MKEPNVNLVEPETIDVTPWNPSSPTVNSSQVLSWYNIIPIVLKENIISSNMYKMPIDAIFKIHRIAIVNYYG